METISKYLEDVAPGGRPGHMEIIDDSVKHEVRVAVVGPRGQFNVVRTGPDHKGSTAGVVFWSEELNAPVIPPRFQAPQPDGLPAWVYYREGCARLGGMDKYEQWKIIDNEQQACKRRDEPMPRYTGMTDVDLYPDWVLARRKSFNAGRREVDLKKLLADRAKATNDEKAALGSLGIKDDGG